MRASLLTKLFAVYLLPLGALLALVFLFGWGTVRGLLDEERWGMVSCRDIPCGGMLRQKTCSGIPKGSDCTFL